DKRLQLRDAIVTPVPRHHIGVPQPASHGKRIPRPTRRTISHSREWTHRSDRPREPGTVTGRLAVRPAVRPRQLAGRRPVLQPHPRVLEHAPRPPVLVPGQPDAALL